MAQPLIATDRIKLSYICAGQTHLLRQYCHVAALSGSTTTISMRGGGTPALWSDLAQYMWDVVRSIMSTTITAADVLLEHLDTNVWNPVASLTATGNGTGSAVNLCEQVSWVFRDQAFNKLKMNLYETDQGFVGHDVDGSGLTTALHNISLSWTSDIDPLAPFNWARSRSDILVANAGGAVGVTLDTNNQIRRARGFA